MLCEIDSSTAEIIFAEGLDAYENQDGQSKESFLGGGTYFDSVVISVEENKLQFIAVPACPQSEVYYFYESDQIIFGDNYFQICARCDDQAIDQETISFFLKKSYSPGGKTFHKKVCRLLPASVFSLVSGRMSHDRIRYRQNEDNGDKADFDLFTEKLELVCKTESTDKNVGILFSGGADSLALALTLEKLDIPFVLYTGEIQPPMLENQVDLSRSRSIASAKGWKQCFVQIDYEEYKFSDLHRMIDKMPNSSHLSLIFLKILSQMKNDGVNVCFSGQNLDNLYNFGATASPGMNRAAIIDVARRFFLSEYYFSSLGKPIYSSFFAKTVAYILLIGYRIMRMSFGYRLPTTKLELYLSFINSADNTVFIDTRSEQMSDDQHKGISSVAELRQELVRSRVESYLASGDSMAIINAARLYGLKAVLPYSAEPLIPIFLNLKTTFIDIFKPKKMIHEIIKMGFYGRPKIVAAPKSNFPSYHDWAKNVFPNTKFATSIENSQMCENRALSTPALKLSCRFANAWKDYVLNRVGGIENE